MIPITPGEYDQYRAVMDALIDNAFVSAGAKLRWRIGDVEGGDDLEMPAVVECTECFGTGFWKGFGAPCKKGCRV